MNDSKVWNKLKDNPIKLDEPIIIKRFDGTETFACFYKTKYASGIVPLEYDKNTEVFIWNGKTFMLKIEYWRKIEDSDLKQ